MTEIGKLKVLVYKTELHMHEDAKKLPNGTYTLPIKDMFKQMIGDAKPKVFLTTGTAGGVYCSMHLGDVMVSRAAEFYCQKDFATATFNHQKFQSKWTIPTKYVSAAEKLMQSFAGHLTGQTVPTYLRIKETLLSYSDIQVRGGWPTLPPTPSSRRARAVPTWRCCAVISSSAAISRRIRKPATCMTPLVVEAVKRFQLRQATRRDRQRRRAAAQSPQRSGRRPHQAARSVARTAARHGFHLRRAQSW